MKKIFNDIKENIRKHFLWYILYILFLSIVFIRVNYIVFTPGGLINLNKRIIVSNEYKKSGSINMTYVSAKKGTVATYLLSYVIPSWDLVSLETMQIENENIKKINERDKILLKKTLNNSIIAAFKEANIEYKVDNVDLIITYVYEFADTNLKINDKILKINGNKISDYNNLVENLSLYKPSEKINILVERNGKEKDCYSVLKKIDNKVVVGVYITEIKNIVTKPNIKFKFKSNESGASSGLMCALEIYNKITRYDITKGKVIAGSGTIDENGNVGEIEGIKYKLKGAVKNKASVFIVPSENYDEALKIIKENNYNIELIKASTLNGVIQDLA